MSDTLDPITVEVIRNYHQSTARQMRNALIRASFNPTIYEMVDFSLGVFDHDANLLAEGPGIPLFVGALTFAIKDVMRYVGEGNAEDGDVILSTHPYWTGSHPQDAVTIRPIFIEGRIFGYAAAKAHWMDIGAKDIYGVDTTDVWQEGLQLFGVKIVKKGVLDRELVEVIRANSRLPDGVIGDMTAQISACNLGAERTLALVSRYGADVVAASNARVLDQAEEIARKAISAMPDGEWTVDAQLDSDGIGDAQVPLRATIRIAGDTMNVDMTGSAAAQKGPVNCPLATTVSIARLVMKMVIAPHHDANEGFFRPLSVHAPEGSILNAQAPSPVFLYGWAPMVLGEQMFRAFVEIAPESAVARSGGDICGFLFSGNHPDGSYFAGGVDECVGQGASFDADGENAMVSYALGESRNTPAEIVEERFPILVEQYALRQDSGGAGRFRGGLGVQRMWRVLDDLSLITVVEQTKVPAWGVEGGNGSVPNRLTAAWGSNQAQDLSKVAGHIVERDQRLFLQTGGGGGWGDPHTRPAEAVLADVVGGYVSAARAETDYGVVIRFDDEGVARIDETATDRARLRPLEAAE
jgi:N-methylhydantoinase B